MGAMSMKPRFRQTYFYNITGTLSWYWKPMNKAAKDFEDMFFIKRGLKALRIAHPKYAQN